MGERLKTIRDISDWRGKRALVRVDFNVPVNEFGRVTEDHRMTESLPTIQYLLEQGAAVILMSHFGRPQKAKSDEERRSKYSLRPVAEHLSKLLPGTRVCFVDDVAGEGARASVAATHPGEVLLLENTRFEPGEEKNDPDLALRLSALGDVYVNDAFGAAHRAHASTEGVARLMGDRVAGLLMEKEYTALNGLLQDVERPFTAIIGGSKVSSKITVLESLLDKVDYLIIGGGMIFTFLRAQGYLTGNSLVEEDYIDTARELMDKAVGKNVRVFIASDIVGADTFKADAQPVTFDAHDIPNGMIGLDIGPMSIQGIQEVLTDTHTVLWNGPMGVFEFPAFAQGTQEVAATIARLTEEGQLKSILGGGDTVAALEKYGFDFGKYTHVSTGGGASLEFIEGKSLPGIAALDRTASPTRV